ncbi:MAG: 23S rRNA (uracil(1939)-C(5))-methyltransferase RlmD [Clostridiales Family XIII bacterium]|jgi:23S rRNA (uracil1939-C5)-methyltransferase|nr:23S rRNA (uracil(1939)-C(5))-methyltransferase RlmD [Clostridiales Family XIII bacterium]
MTAFEAGADAGGAVRITDTDAAGRGVGRTADGLVVFVPGLIPGDLALITVERRRKRFAAASVKRLVEPSRDRALPLCPQFGCCGGCSLQNMRYAAQARLKERQTREKLLRIGGVRDPLIRPVVTMDDPWHYRNKARYATDGANVGFYAAGSRAVVDAPDCPIQAPPANALAGVLRRFVAFRRQAGAGDFVRGLTVRTAFGTGEVMASLSVCGARARSCGAERLFPAMDAALSALPRAKNGPPYRLKSLVVESDAESGAVFVAAGRGAITERLWDLRFELSPRSFFQVNPAGARALGDLVAAYAAPRRTETIFDLYCGAGALGLRCARAAGRVVGVESAASAVADARRNAARNGIKNADFICGPVERALPALLAREKPQTVILDPPRAGCRAELLAAVAVAAPARIVCVSCDPATLARDVKCLAAAGYAFAEATPVDMFPHTTHVETAALLCRANARGECAGPR